MPSDITRMPRNQTVFIPRCGHSAAAAVGESQNPHTSFSLPFRYLPNVTNGTASLGPYSLARVRCKLNEFCKYS